MASSVIILAPTVGGTEYDPLFNLEAVLLSFGQEFDGVSGRTTTRLAQPLAASATQAVVETTLGFPASGDVWIGPLKFAYTSKTDGTFEGLSPYLPRFTSLAPWCAVTLETSSVAVGDTDAPLCDITQALRDTRPDQAQGDYLTKVCLNFGLNRIVEWNEDEWRAAMKQAAFTPRSRRPVLVNVLDALFSTQSTSVAVTYTASAPTRVTAVAGAGTFSEANVGQWVRLSDKDGQTFLVIAADATGSYIELSRIGGTAYNLDPADWTGTVGTVSATLTILAYSVIETPQEPCLVQVQVWGTDSIYVPPTYIQPGSQWLQYRLQTTNYQQWDRLRGGLSGATAIITQIIDNGAKGAVQLAQVEGQFQADETITSTRPDGTPGGDGVATGTNGTTLLAYDGETGGGFTTGDTVTGYSSGAVSSLMGLTDNGTSGYLTLEFIEAPEHWTAGENLTIGGAVHGVAAANSIARYVPQRLWMLYDGSTTAPVVGETLTAGTATGDVVAVSAISGTAGLVWLEAVTGVFDDNATITGSLGADGAVNGYTGDHALSYSGEALGGFAVDDEVTGATSDAVGTVRGVYDAGTTGILVLSWQSGGSAGAVYQDNESLYVDFTARGAANGDSRGAEFPAGEPEYGYLVPSAFTTGDVGTDIAPLYLIGAGVLPELQSFLQRLMAAGVRCEVTRGGFAL